MAQTSKQFAMSVCPPVYYGRANSTNTFTLTKAAGSASSAAVLVPREGSYKVEVFFGTSTTASYKFVVWYEQLGHLPLSLQIVSLSNQYTIGSSTNNVANTYGVHSRTVIAKAIENNTAQYAASFKIAVVGGTHLEFQNTDTSLGTSFNSNPPNSFTFNTSQTTAALANTAVSNAVVKIVFTGIDPENVDPEFSDPLPCAYTTDYTSDTPVSYKEIFLPSGTNLNPVTSTSGLNPGPQAPGLYGALLPGLYDVTFRSKTTNLGVDTWTAWTNPGNADIIIRDVGLNCNKGEQWITPFFTWCCVKGDGTLSVSHPGCIYPLYQFVSKSTYWNNLTGTSKTNTYLFLLSCTYAGGPKIKNTTTWPPNPRRNYYGNVDPEMKIGSVYLSWLAYFCTSTDSNNTNSFNTYWRNGITDGFDMKIIFKRSGAMPGLQYTC